MEQIEKNILTVMYACQIQGISPFESIREKTGITAGQIDVIIDNLIKNEHFIK